MCILLKPNSKLQFNKSIDRFKNSGIKFNESRYQKILNNIKESQRTYQSILNTCLSEKLNFIRKVREENENLGMMASTNKTQAESCLNEAINYLRTRSSFSNDVKILSSLENCTKIVSYDYLCYIIFIF